MSIVIRVVAPADYLPLVPTLADLLVETVDEGASLGFLPPVNRDDACAYWASLHPQLESGSRVIVGAFRDDRIVASGQLALPPWPNAKHRAELQKLFVARSVRGQGVGQSIVAAIHCWARGHGRSLVLLNARRDVADRFYKPLGYQEIGVIPGYSSGSDGGRIDSVALFQQLPP